MFEASDLIDRLIDHEIGTGVPAENIFVGKFIEVWQKRMNQLEYFSAFCPTFFTSLALLPRPGFMTSFFILNLHTKL